MKPIPVTDSLGGQDFYFAFYEQSESRQGTAYEPHYLFFLEDRPFSIGETTGEGRP